MKVFLIGYGKMGKAVETVLLANGHSVLGRTTAGDDLKGATHLLRQADVAIEFTRPEAALSNILFCLENKVPVVSGTTGWLENLEQVRKVCAEKDGAVFYAGNFSIGVYIFSRINELLAKLMNSRTEYDVAINEIHHIHKKDKPSGTAILLANQVVKNLDRKSSWVSGEPHSSEEIPITSDRVDEVPGTHRIAYRSGVDMIDICHTAFNREGFAAGAVAAAEWLPGKKGFFGMDDLMR